MTRRIPLALLVACAASGCLRSTMTIDLRPDGSGTIVQETAMSSEALELMKSFGDPTGRTNREYFTAEAARKAAATMGVTFVSGEPYKTGSLRGYRARFAFDDISKVVMNPDSSGAPLTEAEKKDPLFVFTFDRRPTSSLVTIQILLDKPGGGGPFEELLPGGGGALDSTDKAEAAQALAMARKMLKGMLIDISLNVNGRILKSNAPYVQGSRVTLMQIDFDKLLTDETGLQKLLAAPDTTSASGLPGVKFVHEPKLTIEFSR
jgi:hypothetical protein